MDASDPGRPEPADPSIPVMSRCRALATNMYVGTDSYEMSVNLINVKNDGVVGFIFNYRDDQNYEYVFKR